MRLGVTGQPSGSAVRTADVPSRAGRQLMRVRLAWPAVFAMAAVMLTWCYLLQSRTIAANSDGAAQVLQAQEMLHGNLLLSGWTLSDVSFYTLEVPLDALVIAAHGFGPDVVHFTAAVLYALLVVLSALLARGTARGRAGMIRALLAAVILLAPGLNTGTRVLLLQPDHTGTSVPLLIALLYLDRARERWRTPAMLCVLLFWSQVSDQLALVAGAMAVAAVCLARTVSGIARRTGQWRYDALLTVAAVASAVLARLAQFAITAAGGYVLRPLPHGWQFASLGDIPRQLLWTGENALLLFGADWFNQAPGLPMAIAFTHLVGVLLALGGLVPGVVAIFRRGDRVTQSLAAGTLLVLTAAAFGNFSAPVEGAHEMAVVLPFGAVLAGRVLGPPLARSAAKATRRATAAGLAVLAACSLAALGYNASRPPHPASAYVLADFLRAHHLTRGIASYWAADITTLASGGQVRVAPVAQILVPPVAGIRVPPVPGIETYPLAWKLLMYPRPWESKPSWFNPAVSTANFAVTATNKQMQLSLMALSRQFGPPDRIYFVGSFTVLAWNYNILSQLPGRPPGA